MPRPRHYKPDPDQKTLPIDFGQVMDVFRTMRIGPFSHRWMMFLIWSHVGQRRSTWRMSTNDLAAEMQMNQNAAWRVCKSLDTLGVLRCDKVANGIYDFSICWGVLFGLQDEPSELRAGAEQVRASAEELRAGAEQVRASAEELRAGAEHTICNPALPCTNPSPPSPSARDELRMMVMVKLKETGVGQVGPTIASAEAQGMTLEQIADVIEHYQAFPGRWPQGVLCERLTRAGAHILNPDEGWYGETAEWIHEQARIEREAQARANQSQQAQEDAMPKLITYPQQDFAEAKFGPLLDEMTNPQAAALVQDDPFVAKMCLKGNHRQPGMIRERCISRMQNLAAIEREKQERQATIAAVME